MLHFWHNGLLSNFSVFVSVLKCILDLKLDVYDALILTVNFLKFNEEVRKALEKCDLVHDIQLFIQQEQTGSARPGDYLTLLAVQYMYIFMVESNFPFFDFSASVSTIYLQFDCFLMSYI